MQKGNIFKAGVFCRIKRYFPGYMDQSADVQGDAHHFQAFPLVDPVAGCSDTIYTFGLRLFFG